MGDRFTSTALGASILIMVINVLSRDSGFLREILFAKSFGLGIDFDIYLPVTKYSDYPFKVIYEDKTTKVIEGKFYNKSFSEVKNSLSEKAKSLEFDNEYPNKIGNRISEKDGDYLIFILNGICNKLVMFNDFLGRLSFYYAHLNERIIIFRYFTSNSKLSLFDLSFQIR